MTAVVELGEGWMYSTNTNRIRHEHENGSSWVATLVSLPYRCAECGAIMPERLEFLVRVAQVDYDHMVEQFHASLKRVRIQMSKWCKPEQPGSDEEQ